MIKPTEKEISLVLKKLQLLFKNPGGMEVGNPYQNLVGVILSARTRDEQVLKLLPAFFSTFPTPHKLARATTKQIERHINSIGMYRQKAKHLKSMAKDLVERFGGEVPGTMEDLISLAGVGRKTASVILVASFGQPAIAVDTHVHRVTNRLGWVNTKIPVKTEAALLQLVPKKWYPIVNRVFVKFGRYICLPRKPRCWMCPLKNQCPFKEKNTEEPKQAQAIRQDIERREHLLESLRKKAGN